MFERERERETVKLFVGHEMFDSNVPYIYCVYSVSKLTEATGELKVNRKATDF